MRTAIAAHELLAKGLCLETLSIGTGRVGIHAELRHGHKEGPSGGAGRADGSLV